MFALVLSTSQGSGRLTREAGGSQRIAVKDEERNEPTELRFITTWLATRH